MVVVHARPACRRPRERPLVDVLVIGGGNAACARR
jgi:hypothetical protein